MRSPARARASRARKGARVFVRVRRSRDRTDRGRELAGHVRYALLASRDGGRSFDYVVRPRTPADRAQRGAARPARERADRERLRRNGNCGVKRLGRFKR